MLSRAAGPQICKDATTRKPTQELLALYTLSIKDTVRFSFEQWTQTSLYLNNDWALQQIVIFTSLCKCLDKFGYGKALPAYKC